MHGHPQPILSELDDCRFFFFFVFCLFQGRSLEYGFGAKSGQILLNRVRARAFPPSAEKLL